MTMQVDKARLDELIAGKTEQLRLLEVRFAKSAIPEDSWEHADMKRDAEIILALATELRALRSTEGKEGEPAAFRYEWKSRDAETGWKLSYNDSLSRLAPFVEIRNVVPLYAAPKAAEAHGAKLREALHSLGVQADNAAWNIGKPGHKFTPAEVQAGYFRIRDFAHAALTRSPE